MKNMSTNCTEIRGEFPLHVGGELESPTRERVELHLRQCAACREVLSRAKQARAALLEHFKSGEEFGVQPSIWPRVRETLRAEGLILPEPAKRGSELSVPTPPTPVARSSWGRIYRVAALAAAAALLFLLGSVVGRLGIDPLIAPGPGATGPETDPTVAAELPAGGEILHPVAGRALTPVLAGESLEEQALDFVADPTPSGLPATWTRDNQPATYMTSETTRPDGVR